MTHQRFNDTLHFSGDGIALHEFRVIEDGAEQTLSQKVLHQHLIHSFNADIGIERGAAEVEKLLKGGLESCMLILCASWIFATRPSARSGTRSLNSSVHRLFKALNIRSSVGEELAEERHQLLWDCRERNLAVKLLLVLEEDASFGVLKDDVGEGVAARRLLLDLGVQIVLGVLGFPVAARQTVVVA